MSAGITNFRFVVAVTDPDWLAFVRHAEIAELNFWRPGDASVAATPGTPWLFYVARDKAILGCAYFELYRRLPVWYAWEAFGHANGSGDVASFLQKISLHRHRSVAQEDNIGCVALSSPLFFDDPIDFKRFAGVWTGRNPIKYFSVVEPQGSALWAAVGKRINLAPDASGSSASPLVLPNSVLVEPRLGQGAFRVLVAEAYERRCVVTGERALPALEAAHIKPYSLVRKHELPNGLLFRADIHRLFDQGYVSIEPSLRFRVSRAIREEFLNGQEYYEFDRRKIRAPMLETSAPSAEYLEWHYSTVFKG